MEYDRIIDSVRKLNFIENEEKADAAVKASLGIIASRMKEEDAREFADFLPEPLTFEKLRGHQVYENEVSPDEYIKEIAVQFNLQEDQARELTQCVLRTTRDNLGEEQLNSLEGKLPQNWMSFIKQA